jgi:two-component system chemotaxis response regulator CheB
MLNRCLGVILLTVLAFRISYGDAAQLDTINLSYSALVVSGAPFWRRIGPVAETMKKETKIEAMDMSAIDDENRPGKLAVFGCPDCGGTLWELEANDLLRFRCRVGHAFGSDGLLARQSEALDDALWAAFRALQENASLARRLAARSREQNSEPLARTFDERAQIAAARSEVIRGLLLGNESGNEAAKRNQTEPA